MHGCDEDAPTWAEMQARAELAAARADRLHRALARLLRAYPRLASDFASPEQQAAYRVAVCALEET
ncbi:MAG TPA: hypothetical protein VG994_02770, partial [Steroidobacteraceae bacterium]|nr:hypothetical protein [Steroidobacteraceae bacterium]